MGDIKWPAGQKTFYNQIYKHYETILDGTVLAIDPSSGGSSMPGYAVFRGGEMLACGELDLNSRDVVGKRLDDLYGMVRDLIPKGPDILAIEKIRGNMAHEYLRWSVGVTVAAAKAPVLIEVPICMWKAVAKVSESYAKSNIMDAVYIGKALQLLAEEVE